MTETITLYEQLADRMADHILAGLYQSGERLPSVRKLAEREAVSISTALAAYETLEQRRFVEARPKSGYFVLARANESLAEPQVCCPPSKPVPAHISRLMMDMISNGPQNRHNFSNAEPARDTPIIRQLQRVFGDLSRSQRYLNMGYGPNDGMPELRK
ncbi:MAG: GntR family transcriptional regulator, partial [Natronospirillum sp.]